MFGILCHVSSLYSKYGIGDFGDASTNFIDFLHKNNIHIWQILPITESDDYGSPYGCRAFCALDPMFVSPKGLVDDGYITAKEVKQTWKSYKNTFRINYNFVKPAKIKLLDLAFSRLTKKQLAKVETELKNDALLYNYCYYKTLLEVFNTGDWRTLPKKYLSKNKRGTTQFVNANKNIVLKYAFYQTILKKQWQKILKYAKAKSVAIIGDLPIYSDRVSFDLFYRPDCYKVDEKYNPIVTGGVPADEFCADGQNWGTCVYNWKRLEQTNYEFVIDKILLNLSRYSMLRLDHYLGYVEHYEIDNINHNNKWVKGGGIPLFALLSEHTSLKNFVIEDLGIKTKASLELKNKFNLRGMNVLQFANWKDEHDTLLPNNVEKNSIYYLGTHDNNTFVGYLSHLTEAEKQQIAKVLNCSSTNSKKLTIAAINQMLFSPAEYVVLQVQDVLLQDEKYRMNVPGSCVNCWGFKLDKNYKKIFTKNMKSIKYKG